MHRGWLKRLAQEALVQEKLSWSVTTIVPPIAAGHTKEGEWIIYLITGAAPPVVKVHLTLAAVESDGAILSQIIEHLRQLKANVS